MTMGIWRKFIECSCHSEGIMIGYFDEGRFSHEIFLAFFRNNWTKSFRLSDKLRYIWQIIRYNEPFLDEIVLTRETLNELRIALAECAKRLEDQKEISDAT